MERNVKKIDVALALRYFASKRINGKNSKFLKNGSEKNVVQVQFRRTRNHVKSYGPYLLRLRDKSQ